MMYGERCALSMRKDKAYLRHVLDAISDIKRFMKNLAEVSFYKTILR